jgi:hypothetical protein
MVVNFIYHKLIRGGIVNDNSLLHNNVIGYVVFVTPKYDSDDEHGHVPNKYVTSRFKYQGAFCAGR